MAEVNFDETVSDLKRLAVGLTVEQRTALLSIVEEILAPASEEKKTVDCCLCGDTPYFEEAGTFDLAGKCQDHDFTIQGECCKSCYLKLVFKLREVTTP